MSSLSGVDVDLTTNQHQNLANASINLADLSTSIVGNGLAGTPQDALNTQLSLSQLTDAIADTARSSGNAAAASALDTLAAQTSGVSGTLSLSNLLGGDTRTAVLSQGSINALDLVNAAVATRNVNSAATPQRVSSTGSALGLGVGVGGVDLTVVVIDQPQMVCGPTGSKFYSASLRIRVHAALSNGATNLNLGLASVTIGLTALDLVVAVGRASGTLQSVNAITQAVTVQATPGVAELYLGTVSDAVFQDRTKPINTNTDLGYATIGNVAVTLLGLSTTASIDARAYALGTAPMAQTLSFSGPYPKTLTASTSSTFTTQLVTTLLNSLDVRVNAFVGALDLGTLLTGVVTAVVNTLKTTTNGLLSTQVTGLLTGGVDPLLSQLGVGLGRADVTVDRAFPIPVGTACDDGSFCTSGDTCNASNVCVGTVRDCGDGLSCTMDSCDEAADRCVNTPSNSCVISGACFAAGAGNPNAACQVCAPATSTTQWTARAAGASCSDGQFCTENDTCNVLGICAGTIKSCSDGLSCTLDTCDELSDTCSSVISLGCSIDGACFLAGLDNPQNGCQSCNPAVSSTSWTNKTSGSLCTDGLFCTIGDACDGAGNCASAVRDCGDGLACTLDVCNETLGTCGSSLTGGCVIANTCFGTGTLNPFNSCQQCNPAASTIGWTNLIAGSGCSDGQFCTENDACNELGICTGTAKSCSDGLTCTTDTCNEANDRCDVLLSTGCVINGTCYAAGTTSPDNQCQSCTPTSSTSTWSNKLSGVTCDDSLYCTVNDTCNGAGACTGPARACTTGAGCSAAVCDEDADSCSGPITAGCNILGTCYPSGSVNPLNSCQTCDPATSTGAWTNKALNTSCSDGLFCTTGDTCRAGAICQGSARDCSDGLTCTTDTCNELSARCESGGLVGCLIEGACYALGVGNSQNPCQVCQPSLSTTTWTMLTAGESCNDGQFCTVADACNSAGQCKGTAMDCSTGQSCSTGSCNETSDRCDRSISGCLIDNSCYAPQQTNPNNPCQVCTPATSSSAWSNAAAGAACSDGSFCTVNDACDGAGRCAAAPRSCDDSLDCTVDSCNEVSNQCESVSLASCAIGGVCVPGLTSNPGNSCQQCIPAVSMQGWSMLPVGSMCSDGLFCTGVDSCTGAGVCSGNAVTCNDNLACTSDSCNEANDRCDAPVSSGCAINNTCYADGAADPQNPCRGCNASVSTTTWSNKPADTACTDGKFCTVDACNGAGSCVSINRDCSDGLSCTSDSCDESNDRCVAAPSAGCVINGQCVDADANDPSNDCGACTPSLSRTGWSNKPSGVACEGGVYCTVGRTCDGAGACSGGTPRTCDDEVACSDDSCDESSNACQHVTEDGCVIGTACTPRGTVNADNTCQVCDPSRALSDWSTVQNDFCLGRDDPDTDGLTTNEECPLGRMMCPDTDMDGVPDYLDPDDDGDTVYTKFEHEPDGDTQDTDRDGRFDHLDADDDNDGIPTREEDPDANADGDPADARDTDHDGKPDYLDPDDDDDGILTIKERDDADMFGTSDDEDGDGFVNWLDTDSDGDGYSDRFESRGDGDINADGIPDYLQRDIPGADAGVEDGGVDDGGVDAGVDGGTDPAAGRGGGGGGSGRGGSGATGGSGGRAAAGSGGRPATGGTAAQGGRSAAGSGTGGDGGGPDSGTGGDSGSGGQAGTAVDPNAALRGGGLAGGGLLRCSVDQHEHRSGPTSLVLWTLLCIWGTLLWRQRRD